MRKLIGWIVFGVMLGGAATGTILGQQSWPRFHRYALTRLDDTTTLDMVKDTTRPSICRLVYVKHAPAVYSNPASYPVAVTYLGEVPCDPAPVPPVAPVPPLVASPVR